MANFSEHFLPSDTHTCVCVSGGKKCWFFENFVVLCFLVTPVLRFPFLPYYRRVMIFAVNIISYVSLFWKKLQSAEVLNLEKTNPFGLIFLMNIALNALAVAVKALVNIACF